MIGQRYHEKKIAVLDVCRRYLRLRRDTDDGVDAGFLKGRMEQVENGQYVLAVVGEVKAGKSTFINALLGESILPTNFLQSSSAIVEIFKSKEKYVEIQYADGRVKKVKDDPDTPDLDEAAQYLRHIGAIQDRYREIPTTLIDALIVEGRTAPDRLPPIADLEAKSKLSLHDKKTKTMIREYVQTRKPSDIPQKITFGFPLKYAFDGLQLVDSPGVNALGGVQNVTYGYMQEANALLFVQSLEDSIESSSFSEFVEENVSNRTRETLFLILTKSGMKSKYEIAEKVDEAHRQYKEIFKQDRILHVDSMLKIISEEIVKFDSAASLKEHYLEQRKRYGEKYDLEQDQELGAEAAKFDTKLKLLNNVLADVVGNSDREAVRETLRKLSNFDEMERIIEEFSNRAPELQLSRLLRSVKSGYDNQNRALDGNNSVLKKKVKHPQTFESEISKIQEHLENYRLSMNEHTEKIRKQYSGSHGSYKERFNEIITKCQDDIKQASTIDRVRKALSDYYEEMASFADTIGAQIKSKFEKEMERLETEFKAKHDITVPGFDIEGIVEKAKTKAYGEVNMERSPDGILEWILKIVTLGTKKFHENSEARHLRRCKADAHEAVEKKKTEFEELLRDLIDRIASDFRWALETRIKARNKELEDIKTEKENNEEILKKIEEAKQKKKDIVAELARVSDLLVNLE